MAKRLIDFRIMLFVVFFLVAGNAALCVVRDILWKYSENLFWFSTVLGIKCGGPD